MLNRRCRQWLGPKPRSHDHPGLIRFPAMASPDPAPCWWDLVQTHSFTSLVTSSLGAHHLWRTTMLHGVVTWLPIGTFLPIRLVACLLIMVHYWISKVNKLLLERNGNKACCHSITPPFVGAMFAVYHTQFWRSTFSTWSGFHFGMERCHWCHNKQRLPICLDQLGHHFRRLLLLFSYTELDRRWAANTWQLETTNLRAMAVSRFRDRWTNQLRWFSYWLFNQTTYYLLHNHVLLLA